MYHSRSWSVNSASRMTTFCVQPMVMAWSSTSGELSYVRKNSRIRRRFRGEKPEASGYIPHRYSDAATAAPFSGLPLTSRPISQYSFICGSSAICDSSAAISVSSAANMAL